MLEKVVTQGRILIVDDEKFNVRFLKIILEQAGYANVFSTTEADQVLPLFRKIQPDLVLLDLVMPHKDGLEIMRELQAETTASSIPILVLTADTTLAGKRQALEAGAGDFLTKPLDEIEVLLRIRNLLRTRFHRVLLEEKVREAQLFLQSTFDALTSHIAVIDESGTVLAFNKAWRAFFVSSGGVGSLCHLGDNYVASCEMDPALGDAIEVARGIRAVIAGELPDFSLEYHCEGPTEQLWFTVSITCFVAQGHVRVVVAHENVTQRRRAEDEVRRLGEQHLGQQRVLTHRFITTLEEERRAISFEMHDGLTQYVMSSSAFFDSYAATVASSYAELPSDLQKGLKYLQAAVVEARRMVNGLRSLALDELGLVGALEQLLTEERDRAHWQEARVVVLTPIPRFDTVLETAAYRVVQEALSNIRKHAEAKRVVVRLQMVPANGAEQGYLQIEVRDWGKGFTVSEKHETYDHVGLHSMEERVNLLHGKLHIESWPQEGTRILAKFPFHPMHGGI